LIDPDHAHISVGRQCELLELARSSYYYRLRPQSDLNLLLMNLIDEQYTRTPFYGVPRMTAWLRRQGYGVNHKRIRRLMRLMDLEAIYPKPRLSIPSRLVFPLCALLGAFQHIGDELLPEGPGGGVDALKT
jgi:putative transposase